MRPGKLRLTVVALGAALVTALSGAPSAGAAVTDVPPPGANDWSCRPTAAHPYPVVLVPGTFESMAKNWSTLSPVLEATRAKQVDLVGHSQGGMMPRYYIGFLDGAKKVRALVGIAPSNHGTQGLITPGSMGVTTSDPNPLCPACSDQTAGSPFLQLLNAEGDVVPGPYYTVLSTVYDEVVTPYTSQALAGSPRQVTNIVLQDRCPLDPIEHDQAPNDPVVHQWVLEALSHRTGPAGPAFQPVCAPPPA